MDVYREQLLDHYRSPRNYGLQAKASAQASSFNPLCGDRVTVQLDIANDSIIAMRFDGYGCAISMAAASLLSEYVVNRPPGKIMELDATLVQTLLGTTLSPVRLKCALLPLKTIHQALITNKTHGNAA